MNFSINNPTEENQEIAENYEFSLELFNKGNINESLRVLENIINDNPNFPCVYHLLSECNFQKENYSDCFKYNKICLNLLSQNNDYSFKNLLICNIFILNAQIFEKLRNHEDFLNELKLLEDFISKEKIDNQEILRNFENLKKISSKNFFNNEVSFFFYK